MNPPSLLYESETLPTVFEPHGYLNPFGEEERTDASDRTLAICIWLPAGFMFAVAALIDPRAAAMIAGTAIVLHSILRPRVAVYFLVAAVPMEWMVSVLPQVTTLPKLLGVLALLVSLPRIIRSATPGRWDASAKWMLLLVGWAGLSIAWSRYKQPGFISWQSLLTVWGMTWLICLQLDSPSRFRMALYFIFGGCMISCAVMLWSGDVHRTATTSARIASESLVGETLEASFNTQAREYAYGVLIALYIFITRKGAFQRTCLAAAIIILLSGIVFAKARGVWVALPLAVVGGNLLLTRAGISRRVILIGLIGLLSVASGVAMSKFGFLGRGIEERFASIFEEGVRSGNRLEFWKAHAQAFFRTGFVGTGYNQMQFTAASLYHVAHNDFFSIIGELGAVGLFAFAGLHLNLFRRMMRFQDAWSKMFCLMLWLFILGAGLTGTDFDDKQYPLAVGIILAAIQLDERRRAGQLPGSVF